jgi:hypothetical protein
MSRDETGYGLVAEFEDAHTLLDAARRAREAGYRKLEAYTPYHVEGLAEAVGVRRSWLPLMVLGGGVMGAAGGFFLQYYLAVVAYPLNVGGRPLNSWQAFMPVTFELAILVAVLAAFVGMLFLSRLPTVRYPLSNVMRFGQAQADRFFLAIEADDPAFDRVATREFLLGLAPSEVHDA